MGVLINFIENFAAGVLAYFEAGGFVMPPLAVATLVLWYALGFRWQVMQRGNRRSVRVLLERYSRGYKRPPRGLIDTAVVWGMNLKGEHRPEQLRDCLEDAFTTFEEELSQGKAIIRSIVATAPLAGLLGTVIGMIETFDSLADMALFSQTGGIAGGISQALFTTQMGLAVAVPGIVVGRILDRREARLRDELAQLKDMICTSQAQAAAS